MKIRVSILKLTLDLFMFVTLMILYSKNVISLKFHEVAGLIVLFVVFFHIIINGKWVGAVTKRLFGRLTPVRTKVLWIVDFFLLIFTLALIITGLLISKAFLPNFLGGHNSFIPIHFFVSAIFLALLGIHLGLHFKYIANTLSKRRKHSKLLKITLITLAVLIVGGGVYNVCTSAYTGWLTAPFVVSKDHEHENKGKRQGEKRRIRQPVTVSRIAKIFGTSASIAFLFGIAAYSVDEVASRKKHKIENKVDADENVID